MFVHVRYFRAIKTSLEMKALLETATVTTSVKQLQSDETQMDDERGRGTWILRWPDLHI